MAEDRGTGTRPALPQQRSLSLIPVFTEPLQPYVSGKHSALGLVETACNCRGPKPKTSLITDSPSLLHGHSRCSSLASSVSRRHGHQQGRPGPRRPASPIPRRLALSPRLEFGCRALGLPTPQADLAGQAKPDVRRTQLDPPLACAVARGVEAESGRAVMWLHPSLGTRILWREIGRCMPPQLHRTNRTPRLRSRLHVAIGNH
jgi:hypothetical protein